ncbi:helix-turn-helix transcriptional regulator [Actinocorallia sp. A-T 12471]|uniref:helix-turn-helix domain-containing protein n=1 Tax=Actinocorallia sp. A-T 12471 TaxID=3089813 RepID=UPI0029D0B72C|nr:helix-turn-helix transcriptional regulator [Actinocorallia sp. A-T 12471]MDX6742384.1 helix-turn-helix transcriptional regulator [Actinocorallia sp. A-T 12471]
MSTSIVLRRRLASRLVDYRKTAGLTQRDAAAHLGAGVSKIIRIETAESTVSVGDLRSLLTLYKITDPEECDELVELARQARKRGGWWSAYRDLLSGPFLALEAEAARISDYEPSLIPGLLQTEGYAYRLIATLTNVHEEEVQRLVQVRMRRQRRLYDDDAPLVLDAIIDEAALIRTLHCGDIAREQLERLLKDGERPNISIRVVPKEAGIYPAIGYPFVIIGFPGPDPDIVLTETRVGEQYLHDAQEVGAFVSDLRELIACALDEEDSARLIRSLIRKLVPIREDPDSLA